MQANDYNGSCKRDGEKMDQTIQKFHNNARFKFIFFPSKFLYYNLHKVPSERSSIGNQLFNKD